MPLGRTGPSLSKRGEAELTARREREAAALRANLRRRKEQQRAADEGEASPSAADPQQPPVK